MPRIDEINANFANALIYWLPSHWLTWRGGG
ncbi:hypothetical protein VCHC57A2_1526, partial [Vibrio cholerae HC-57A2]